MIKQIAKIVMLLSFVSHANESTPQSMGALGDSITAAAFGAYTRTDGQHPTTFLRIMEMISKFGYYYSARAVEAREVSWSTGNSPKIDSHWTRLMDIASGQGIPFQAFNAAESGAKAKDLTHEVDNLLKWSKENLKTGAPDYVTLLIGANDACTSTPKEDYSRQIKRTFHRILNANPNSKIMVLGIPDISHLRNVAVNSPVSNLPGLRTCQDIWNMHGFCSAMLKEKDPAKRELVMDKVHQYMDAMKEETDAANAKFGLDRVRYVPEIYDYDFTDQNISIDCFHPNVKGQQIISDTAWEKSWWN